MFTLIFPFALASVTTTMTFDWGIIVTAITPTLAIIVTWYLQRKTTRENAEKVAVVHQADTAQIKQSVEAVHTVVNGKNDALLARVRELEDENRQLKGK